MSLTLLIPLDGSRFGEHALPLALTLARKTPVRLHLVHGHQRLDAAYAEMQTFDETLDEQMRTQERAYLEHTAEAIHKVSPDLRVTTALQDGHVASVIQDQAKVCGADLILMTTHARGAMARFWLGSVTDELLRDSPVPLLLAHPQAHAPDLAASVKFDRWVIPLDGTELAEQVLEPALKLIEIFGAEITLLRVTKPVIPVVVPLGVGTFGSIAQDMMDRVETLNKQVEQEATEYLFKVAGRLRSRGFRVNTQVVSEEQPGVAILHQTATGVDAIALGTHGHRGLKRMFLGSVADKVVRGAQIPVLVQRPRDKR
jgi:nucleotide-binding universal stress UspA family protein